MPLPSQQKHGRVISPLCFGTVQLGVPYGVANRSGMPDGAAARALLSQAAAQGITFFDTARAYGISEKRLGEARDVLAGATIITKCAPLDGCDDATPVKRVEELVAQSVAASCAALGREMLPYVLLHRAEQLQQWQGAVWRLLAAHPQVERVGVSVATPQEALTAIANPVMTAMQLPFHILDARWGAVIGALEARPDMLVMARSSLLQGVLTLPPEQWPVVRQAEVLCVLLDGWVREFGRAGRVDLCLAYVRAQGWIDSVVLGMETEAQLRDNIELFQRPALDAVACTRIDAARPLLEETFLNPAHWPKRES